MRDTTNEEQTLTFPTIAGANTYSSGDMMNYAGKGLAILIDVSGYSAGTITDVIVQGKVNGTYKSLYIFTGLALAANGQYAFLIYPGAASAASWSAAPLQGVIPLKWRSQLILTGVAAMTLTTTAVYIG